MKGEDCMKFSQEFISRKLFWMHGQPKTKHEVMVPNMSFKSLRLSLDNISKQEERKQVRNQRKNWVESNIANFYHHGDLIFVWERQLEF